MILFYDGNAHERKETDRVREEDRHRKIDRWMDRLIDTARE